MGHAKETYHNKKMKEIIIPIVPTNVVKHVAKVIAQPIKPGRVPLQYPLFILMLNTVHWIVLERRKFKTCPILRQTMLLL
jgi:hypothetical protein